MFQLAR